MGYTHYWHREKEIPQEKFTAIIDDFRTLLPHFKDYGVYLANGFGDGLPEVNDNWAWFNGSKHCGHPKNSEIILPWPAENVGGVGNQEISGAWFAGAELQTRCCDGDCSFETFYFPRLENREPDECGKVSNMTKTGFRPYDLAVTAFLVIAKHHLGDEIIVRSDGLDQHWFDAKLLCYTHLNYGLNFTLDTREKLEALPKKQEPKEKREVITEHPKETAKKIRQTLKEKFPGVKFSVRTSTYTGGSSIDIRWTDGPRVEEVNEIAQNFKGASFDAMQDLKTPSAYEYNGKLYRGADFVFCNRELTGEYKEQIDTFLNERYSEPDNGLGFIPNFRFDEAEQELIAEGGDTARTNKPQEKKKDGHKGAANNKNKSNSRSKNNTTGKSKNQNNVIQFNDPDAPATKKQRWALHCITKRDTRNWNITREQASELIKRANAGEDITQDLQEMI